MPDNPELDRYWAGTVDATLKNLTKTIEKGSHEPVRKGSRGAQVLQRRPGALVQRAGVVGAGADIASNRSCRRPSR